MYQLLRSTDPRMVRVCLQICEELNYPYALLSGFFFIKVDKSVA